MLYETLLQVSVGFDASRESTHQQHIAIQQAADRAQLLHCDISCYNIMLGSDGRGILNDWDNVRYTNSAFKSSVVCLFYLAGYQRVNQTLLKTGHMVFCVNTHIRWELTAPHTLGRRRVLLLGIDLPGNPLIQVSNHQTPGDRGPTHQPHLGQSRIQTQISAGGRVPDAFLRICAAQRAYSPVEEDAR